MQHLVHIRLVLDIYICRLLDIQYIGFHEYMRGENGRREREREREKRERESAIGESLHWLRTVTPIIIIIIIIFGVSRRERMQKNAQKKQANLQHGSSIKLASY